MGNGWDVEDLRRLYVDEGLSLSAIAVQYGCSLTTVWHRLQAAGIVCRPFSSQIRYPRRDFSGNLAEEAYLIGLRLGDLHVAQAGDHTIPVKCTSTRTEQVELFRLLFEQYGHVYTDEATLAQRKRQSVAMEARLNMTFDFLLPKQDGVPEWILRSDQAFFAFLAGYIDAEGYFRTYSHKGQRMRLANLEVRSYDSILLSQLGEGLNARRILCPPARLRVKAGYTNREGVRSNRHLWGLGVNRDSSLARLCEELDGYLRHGRRRRDMLQVWSLVTERLKVCSYQ